MGSRSEQVLDAAITLLGDRGVRAVTHRAVDDVAGLPSGSTSNLFRTRDALFDGIVERFVARERASWERLAATTDPGSRAELAHTLAALAHHATTGDRTLTLSRYAILIESARRPTLRRQLAASGAEVNGRAITWLRDVGSLHPVRDTHLVLNYWTGLVLHELAMPDPAFDPEPRLEALLDSLIPHESRTSPA